ncbi:MAG: response regulator [Anaerolineae bacterium]
MSFKVLFVEDEIVTREGIRDNVDWKGNGFDFVGEAPDGEMALPLLETTHPDVLITDIKMPFMDGLQLSRIVRERMPWVKIIILSGHDEFEYAQEAIKLGVTEYLLKPVTAQNLHNALQRVAAQLAREQREKENVRKLQEQLDENRAILKEKLLLKLIMGGLSPAEAIDQGGQLGLDLLARYYLVVVIRIQLGNAPRQFDYQEYLRVQHIVSGAVEKNPDVFLLQKDLEELVLLLKGNTPEYLFEERDFSLDLIKRQVRETRCRVTIGVGMLKERLSDVYPSFLEALVSIQGEADEDAAGPMSDGDRAGLLKVDKAAVENYLRRGTREEFEEFFDHTIRPIAETACRSPLIKNYIFIDIVLAATQFVNGLGGNVDQLIPNLNSIGATLVNIRTVEQVHAQAQDILQGALAFRDSQTSNQYAGMIRQAREYIDARYADPDLALNQVAAQVSLSPSHFSAVFSQETGQTFKEYLTEVRLNKAQELLRTTALRSSEISFQVGYSDPHYFSYVFRKNTGLTPKEFRAQGQRDERPFGVMQHGSRNVPG